MKSQQPGCRAKAESHVSTDISKSAAVQKGLPESPVLRPSPAEGGPDPHTHGPETRMDRVERKQHTVGTAVHKRLSQTLWGLEEGCSRAPSKGQWQGGSVHHPNLISEHCVPVCSATLGPIPKPSSHSLIKKEKERHKSFSS